MMDAVHLRALEYKSDPAPCLDIGVIGELAQCGAERIDGTCLGRDKPSSVYTNRLPISESAFMSFSRRMPDTSMPTDHTARGERFSKTDHGVPIAGSGVRVGSIEAAFHIGSLIRWWEVAKPCLRRGGAALGKSRVAPSIT